MLYNIQKCLFMLIFFFSSRRRHTRCGRDWSSDVCSSDLPGSIAWVAGVDQRDLGAVGHEDPRHVLGPRVVDPGCHLYDVDVHATSRHTMVSARPRLASIRGNLAAVSRGGGSGSEPVEADGGGPRLGVAA